MSLLTASDDDVRSIDGIITDPRPLNFHAVGLAGCINRLTHPLRESGMVVRMHTPHHGVEIDTESAIRMYRTAQEALSAILDRGTASEVDIRLAAVYHGIRLTVTDNSAPDNCAPAGSSGKVTLTLPLD